MRACSGAQSASWVRAKVPSVSDVHWRALRAIPDGFQFHTRACLATEVGMVGLVGNAFAGSSAVPREVAASDAKLGPPAQP